MTKYIMAELKFNYKDTFIFMCVTFFAWLFGEVLFAVLSVFIKELNVYIPVGAIVLAFTALIIMLIFPVISNYTTFNIAVGMGRTRKQFLIGVIIYQCLSILVTLLFSSFLVLVGSSVIKNMLYGYMLESSYTDGWYIVGKIYASYWWAIFIIALLGSLCSIVFMALMKKFSKKFFWVVWGIWMLFSLGMSSMVSMITGMMENEAVMSVVSVLQNVPVGVYGVFGTLFFVAVNAWAINYMLKASVSV